MLKPVQVSSRDHRWVSSWCWGQYRCLHVITGEWVLDVEATTGITTWPQVSEFLVLRPIQVSSRDHRWVSSWRWSQYRCHHAYNWVSSILVKTTTMSCLPCPTHIAPDRSALPSTSRMTSLVLIAAVTPHERPLVAAAAAEVEILESTSRTSWLSGHKSIRFSMSRVHVKSQETLSNNAIKTAEAYSSTVCRRLWYVPFTYFLLPCT